ncbi:DopA [Sporothrix brasiliensis 5110]|uniref:DopA n=1 Tax=Sporothrix brasiliensis 5110 TaxID=1398154 RepID=A0A0C2IUC5_9PEZI|nr:DopA [Sporothrix brasiliensis 5110]KIH90365.1 DopA [Sporothrix brasiliensis 5110]
MAPELPSGRRSMSPESSGRDSPAPRQWRNQLGADEPLTRDKAFRKYATGVDRALSLFETALQEWADYISFLNRLLKALQSRQASITTIPAKAVVAKRLSQCLNPSLPSGVHQKALEVYNLVFSIIGTDGLSRDMPLYLPGLAPTLSFASLSVRAHFFDLLERHFLDVEPRSLRPALKALILALLPALEDETAEDFDRTLKLLNRFKTAVRPLDSEELTPEHATGDDFFWQCFFLATITSQSRRPGALAYLTRYLPKLGQAMSNGKDAATKASTADAQLMSKLSEIITSPEPGLLLRCFTAGLADEQLLIQRGFLDLLVAHLPLHAAVLQSHVKPADLELLMRAACGVVTRREMSLNRRLTAWLLGPTPANGDAEREAESPSVLESRNAGFAFTQKTSYFEEHGLHPLTRALLSMVQSNPGSTPAERARPYRICLSLMDRWEIGGLVVPEVFLPIVDSVRKFKAEAASKADFNEVLRSASVFFDGVESGLIYGEMLSLVAQAIGPGGNLSAADRADKLALVKFILGHFNVREEEMTTIHAPLSALSILSMLEDMENRTSSAETETTPEITIEALGIAADLLDIVPERAFVSSRDKGDGKSVVKHKTQSSLPNAELLKKIRDFYVNDQGNLDTATPPYAPQAVADLLLQRACSIGCQSLDGAADIDLPLKSRILLVLLDKIPLKTPFNVSDLLSSLHGRLVRDGDATTFTTFSSILTISIDLHLSERISTNDLSAIVPPLVARAWKFLSATEPKYHVETVRNLWLLQTALGTTNRDIEAAIAELMIRTDVKGAFASRNADPGRNFGVLWLHTLQDSNPSASDRRTPKTPKTPSSSLRSFPRLAGVDHYDVMLTRPLLLMLDALLDERTQLFMAVKTWLTSLVGLDRLFLILAKKFLDLGILRSRPEKKSVGNKSESSARDTDIIDTDMCLYYLRTLSNIFKWAPETLWAVLARRTISLDLLRESASDLIKSEDTEVTYQEFFVHVCMKCIVPAEASQDGDPLTDQRDAQLCRFALSALHQILLSPHAAALSKLHLEDELLERLAEALQGPDPYIQTLLLDVLPPALKLRDVTPVEQPASPNSEKRKFSGGDISKMVSPPTKEVSDVILPPPASLLKCIQAGLSAPSSRAVLDSWVGFLSICLPFYTDSIFQVLIPLVETLCAQVGATFSDLQETFRNPRPAVRADTDAPETTLISLLNALEQILATGHQRLLAEESRVQSVKSPDQPQSFFGNIFASDAPQTRSSTANDRLTVLLAFQDAVRICFRIWSWGKSGSSSAAALDMTSAASFSYTSMRVRNRARRLLEHLFRAETLECLETAIDIWRSALVGQSSASAGEQTTAVASKLSNSGKQYTDVFDLLLTLDASRPRHSIPAIFNSIYSRTNPTALDPARKSTLTISLQDTDIVVFLVDYTRSLEDDVMDEIWQDCTIFLKDLLGNPFPHRQSLPCLLEFAAILGEKVDNTNFGEQRKMRRELGDMFLRLLTALFTTRPITFPDGAASGPQLDRGTASVEAGGTSKVSGHAQPSPPSVLVTADYGSPSERADDVVGILSSIVPNLPKILMENDRVQSAATTISSSVIVPTIRAKSFPETMSRTTLVLLQELSRLPNNQKGWKKDVSDAFNDARFFATSLPLVRSDWLTLLRQWSVNDKERMPELLSRLTAPTTAGIVFGVGATSARLEADRRTQLTLRRVALLILAGALDAFVSDLPTITEKLVELLGASATSSPSSTTRAEVYLVLRALVLRTSAVHLAGLWPLVDSELHAAIASIVAPDNSTAADTYNNASLLQACKLLDLLVCVAPDDFQLREWLFVTDTIDAVYRSAMYQPVALADELSEELGSAMMFSHHINSGVGLESATALATNNTLKRPLLGAAAAGGLSDEVSLERKDELVSKVLRPFFSQLSIYAFESTYTMAPVDTEGCVDGVLKDLFDERAIVKAL